MARLKETYKNNLYFTDSLKRSLDAWKDRVVNQNKASLIIIDGAVGSGKTTLGVHCCDYLMGKRIKFEEQLGTGGGDFTEKLYVCATKQYVVVAYDEAGDFTSRGALSRFNAQLNRIFETYRVFKIVVILILPNFNVLDKSLFNKGIVRALIHCHNRTNKYGCFSIYTANQIYYLLEKMRTLIVKPKAYQYVSAWAYGKFKNLPLSRSNELDDYSSKNKLDILQMAKLKMDGFMSYREIAVQLNRSIIWVKKKVGEYNIPHAKIIKKKKYFDKDIMDELLTIMDEGE